jgi:hypothetical protein
MIIVNGYGRKGSKPKEIYWHLPGETEENLSEPIFGRCANHSINFE